MRKERDSVQRQEFRTIDFQNIAGKRVLVRVDIDVELARGKNEIANDFKLRAQVPLIEQLKKQGAVMILAGHFGRPEGRRDMRYSLAPMAKTFADVGYPVKLLEDCVGGDVEEDVLHAKPGEVFLLENLRFHKEETENDIGFAQKLARLADIYINNAFANSHRAHASMVAITSLLPSFAGPLLEKEIAMLSFVLKNPKRPVVLVIGGAKIETKLPVIKNFLKSASKILVGGAVANTILAAKGYRVEASKVEKDFIGQAKRLLRHVKILPPKDAVTSPNPHGKSRISFRDVRHVGSGEMILDIGSKTVELFSKHIKNAGTVAWNGPMGLFEIPAFASGTQAIARAVAASRGYKVVGGGETGIVLKNLGLEGRVDHLSTGGGAMLEFLAGKKLPALAALGYYG